MRAPFFICYNETMIDADTTEYYKLLYTDYPDWLDEYINTRELQTQKYVSVSCGLIYTDLFPSKVFYSSLAQQDIQYTRFEVRLYHCRPQSA